MARMDRRALGTVAIVAVFSFAAIRPCSAEWDCNVHRLRNILVPGGTPLANTSYRQACKIQGASQEFGEWPICVNNTNNDVESDKTRTQCPAGYTEVGRCKPSGDWYRTSCHSLGLSATCTGDCPGGCGPTGEYPTQSDNFHNFVPTPAQCEMTVHDVLSAVENCKAMCARFFHDRYFDPTAQHQSTNGSWRLGPSPGYPNFSDSTYYVGACQLACGPVFWDTPPYGDGQDNHWHYVTFSRWNPNSDLDGWLRSYTVNKDKPDAPIGNCQGAVESYCSTMGLPLAKKNECKKGRLLIHDRLLQPYALGGGDFWQPITFDLNSETVPNPDDDAFCDLFFRGNVLATDTCYRRGDGQVNWYHRCASTIPDAACSSAKLVGGASCDACNANARCTTADAPAYAVATITQATVIGGSLSLRATYTAPAGTTTVAARWENRTPGCPGVCSGPLSISGSDWEPADVQGTPVNIPLVAGPNAIYTKFVDSRLRTSGDTIDITF
jgi:hypothetical protein